jgi:hypothetical protein
MARLQTVFFCSLLLLSGICARASSTFNVDISSYSTNYCCWGTPESTALEGGVSNTGSLLTFSDPNADYVAVGHVAPFSGYYSGSVTIDTGDANLLSSNVDVNTLINLFNGQSGDQVTITFTNSLSQTYVVTLTVGATVRDYHNNDNGVDTLTGTGTGVTAVNWWNNGVIDDNGDTSVEPDQRLDAQTFVLPADWAGTTLTSMEIQYAGTNSDDAVLSAFQIEDLGGSSPTPEPSTLALVAASLVTLGVLARRRQKLGAPGQLPDTPNHRHDRLLF